MCGGFIGDIIDRVVDIVEDVVDIVVDIVEDVIGWLIPQPEIPEFGELIPEQQAKGILVNKFTANAKNLQKTFDISRAIGYINEQYRSVYKSKPGGLNSILQRVDSKDRLEEDLEKNRGASGTSGGSTGGSGGSSGY